MTPNPDPFARLPGYQAGWSPEVALWHPEGASAEPRHASRDAAWRLVGAGLDGLLGRIETGRVLRALRTMQVTDGPRRGCFRWYWEDAEAVDTNAAFFTGLGLIVLKFEFNDALAPEDRPVLDLMLDELALWFDRDLTDLAHHLRYPNKCLGDLVCAWLLAEISGKTPPGLAEQMKAGADYYCRTAWGWGEHLSDIYATVIHDELTALLLYGRTLPPDLRQAYEWLSADLNGVDARFQGGPRVPAIRSYQFMHSPLKPGHPAPILRPYRDKLEAWPPADPTGLFVPLRGLAEARGFRARHPVPPPAYGVFETPCFDGARALTELAPDWRLGALTRSPLMVDTEQPTWGLGWQTMPVTYWHRRGDWAFPQWETVEGGVTRAHPTLERWAHPPLTDRVDPPFTGLTEGARAGGAFVVVRRMPAISPGWTSLVDRVRLLDSPDAGSAELSEEGPWQVLTLRHQLRILFHPLGPGVKFSVTHPADTALHWNVHYPLDTPDSALAGGLWIWQAGEGLPAVPRLEKTAGGVRLDFPDGSSWTAPAHAVSGAATKSSAGTCSRR